jgi:hypothetical protein
MESCNREGLFLKSFVTGKSSFYGFMFWPIGIPQLRVPVSS